MQSYHVKAFTGGMNNALHGSFPDANTARELVDCDVSNGKLKPARLSREMPESDPEKYGHYGNRNRSVVKWYGRTYWSENKTLKGPYYGGHEENYLGIPYPEAQPTLVHLTKGSGETG